MYAALAYYYDHREEIDRAIRADEELIAELRRRIPSKLRTTSLAERIKFYMDEHVPRAVTAGLRRRGVDALTAQEAGKLEANDEKHLAFASGTVASFLRKTRTSWASTLRVTRTRNHLRAIADRDRCYRSRSAADLRCAEPGDQPRRVHMRDSCEGLVGAGGFQASTENPLGHRQAWKVFR